MLYRIWSLLKEAYHYEKHLILFANTALIVMGLLWLVHLPLGFLYGAPLPFYLLLGGMMLLDGVNLFLSRRSASRARELGAALAFLAGSALGISAGFSC